MELGYNQKATWKKLHKNLLQQLNQQSPSLFFIFSQLESLDHVADLPIDLRKKRKHEPTCNSHHMGHQILASHFLEKGGYI